MTPRSAVTFFALTLWTLAAAAQESRPNILLIVADDLGYADLGVHGSIIRTPNIDALAGEGILFTQFNTAPSCAPTRSMLLTGNHPHRAGMAKQGSFPGPVIPGLAGYENHLSDERVALLPRLLRDAGYRTYMAGKWHLGDQFDQTPYAAGFQRSFAMKFGAGPHFSGRGIRPTDRPRFWENDGEADWPEGAYSTELYTDLLIEYLEEDKDSEDPFFVYAAYTSPHWPLQVPDEDLYLYDGDYDLGYDWLREENFRNLKAAGIIPAHSRLPPRNPAVAHWDELSAEQQRLESRKMELYAAMIENLDRHIGRLLDYLHDNDLYDDTLIVFMSDNGAAAEDFYYWGPFVDYIQATYDDSLERAGMAGNYLSYGAQWAHASAAPFRGLKVDPSEGGVRAPMIVAGYGVESREEFSHEFLTVMDFAPTFLELAGASYPDDKVPMLGKSLTEYLGGDSDEIHDDEYVTVVFNQNRASIRQGDWKLLTLEQPFDERDFGLYNLAEDPGESVDLSLSNPRERQHLLELWRTERQRLGITLPEDL